MPNEISCHVISQHFPGNLRSNNPDEYLSKEKGWMTKAQLKIISLLENHSNIVSDQSCFELYVSIYLLSGNSTMFSAKLLNLSPPSTAYMRQRIGSALVQIMACRLFGTKPLSKLMLVYCQLNPKESKYKLFIYGNASENTICEMAAILSRASFPFTWRFCKILQDYSLRGMSTLSLHYIHCTFICRREQISHIHVVFIRRKEQISYFRWFTANLWFWH